MIDHVVEGLAEDGDAELGHAGEVTLGEPTRLVDLGEEHLLGRPFDGPPLFDPALQATELDVGKATREAALQVQEEGLGLEARIEPEQVKKFGPDVLERVLPGPPGMGNSPLTGEGVGVAVLAHRLLVEIGPFGSVHERGFGLEQLPQPPELTIGDHPFAPVSREPKWDSLPGSGAGNSNDRWSGILIVADHHLNGIAFRVRARPIFCGTMMPACSAPTSSPRSFPSACSIRAGRGRVPGRVFAGNLGEIVVGRGQRR